MTLLHSLPWWLWLLLAPLMIVVGLGALAAAAVLLVGGGVAIFDTLFGGLLERSAERRQLRVERAALEKGHWPPLAALHAGSPSLAERWRSVLRFGRDGEVTRLGDGAWQIGALEDGTKVVFHHRAGVEGLPGRTITVGDGPHLHVATFVLSWAASALRRRALDEAGEPTGGYRSAPSIDAAFRSAAAVLGAEQVPPPPPSLVDLEVLLAYAEPSLPGRVVAAPDRSTLTARYEAWLTRLDYQPRPPLSEFADLFPEHATAGEWIALTEAAPADLEDYPDGHHPDEVEADSALYLDPETLRIVEVCFSDAEPWVRADYHDASALVIDRILVPAVDREIDRLAQATLKTLTLG